MKLASIYSATGDHTRYLEALDKIADYYLEQKKPIEALEYLEKILQAIPESEKHRELHRQAFTEALSGRSVRPACGACRKPVIPPSPCCSCPNQNRMPSPGANSPEIVEVDLLLNYGLKEKALSLLRNLETRDPGDKEVRVRLLSIFKAENKFAEAAEQCLLLAALYRRSKNEDAVQDYLAEAKQLAPDMAEYEQDLEEFARQHGIVAEPMASTDAEPDVLKADAEVDLSADLMDIFFVGDQEPESDEDSEISADSGYVSEAIGDRRLSSRYPSSPIQIRSGTASGSGFLYTSGIS